MAANNLHSTSAGNSPSPKPLGQYLVEAGLLNEAQIRVALADQQVTGMRFGDVLVARGWMKEQTVEYLMRKVVVPERRRLDAKRSQVEHPTLSQQKNLVQPHAATSPTVSPVHSPSDHTHPSGFKRKDPPIAKPLPSVNSVDSDVSWVG